MRRMPSFIVPVVLLLALSSPLAAQTTTVLRAARMKPPWSWRTHIARQNVEPGERTPNGGTLQDSYLFLTSLSAARSSSVIRLDE